MAISRKLLNPGENVVIDTRTHPKALIWPLVCLVLLLAVVQLLASGAACIGHVSALQYLDAWSAPPWLMLVAALAALAALAAIEIFDLADVLGTRLKRAYTPALPAPGRAWAVPSTR